MSDTNRTQLAYIAESTWGTQVTGSALQLLRITGESLKQESSMSESGEIRSDRQVSDIRRTRIQASGGFNFELSYGTYDDFLAAALQAAAWGTAETVTASTISFAASGNTISDSGSGFGSLVANQWVKISGASTAANNGFFKILTAAAGSITVSGGTLVDESAGQSVTVLQGGQIVNGQTLTSFNLERGYTDLTNKFALFLGMAINGLSLNVPLEGRLTGSFDLLGAGESSVSSSGGTGYTAATTTPTIVDAEVVSLLENQAAMTISNFSFNLTNNLRARMRVGSAGVLSLGSGAIGVTGSLSAYYSDETLYDKYLNETASALALPITDSAGNSYLIDLPAVKYTNGQRTPTGPNGDCFAEMQFGAYRDSSEDVTIRMARFAA